MFRRIGVLAVLLYVALDLADAKLPGAFQFDGDVPVIVASAEAPGRDAPALATLAPAPQRDLQVPLRTVRLARTPVWRPVHLERPRIARQSSRDLAPSADDD